MESSNEFYNQGWEAYENNITWRGNPYTFDSGKSWHWNTGWGNASYFYDNGDDFEDYCDEEEGGEYEV